MSRKKWIKHTNAVLSVGLVASLLAPALPTPVEAATTTASDLLISEYVEGGSFNKAIELYNGTSEEIDLSEYSLEIYSNGSVTATNKVNLIGTLAAGNTFVVFHKDANEDIKAVGNLENSSVTNFSGDDPLVLKKNETVIDSIGQVGLRVENMKDITLVRKPNITTGDTVIDDAFNPGVEWNTLPKDNTDYLGSHTLDGSNPGEPENPIPDVPLEIISIVDARNSNLGETVTVKGIVAANLKNTISVQDATGGIAVRPTSLGVKIGDEVILTGKLADYKGLMQLDSAKLVEKTENVKVPVAQVLTGAGVGEDSESELVTIKNVELIEAKDGGTSGNFIASDGTKDFIVRDESNVLDLQKGMKYESITGIVQQFDNDFQVIPRFAEDVVIDSSVMQPASAVPGSGTFVGSTSVALKTSTKDAAILYTLDGKDPVLFGTKYNAPIEITENTTLKTVVKSGDEFSEVTTFEYKITDSLKIHDIQGAGHASPMDGQNVEKIQGVVTSEYELSGSTYYHIQTPDELIDNDPKTSEAIVLYSGKTKWPINVGDLVSVDGKVSEYAIDGYSDRQQTDLKTTQINVRDDQGGNVKVIENNVELPKNFMIDESNIPTEFIDSDQLQVFNPDTDAIDFWESIEGMRVEVGNVKAVSPQENGDLVTVLESMKTDTLHGGLLMEKNDQNPERIQFRLDPNGPAREFEVATGDKFKGPIEGVVGYSYQNYKIFSSLGDLEEAHIKGTAKPETTTIVKANDKLTIASYNLENFSNNKSETSDDKAQKLARAIAKDMNNPDIVGVTEVQDNNGEGTGGSEAAQSYERLIQAIKDAQGVEYEYVNIDPVANADGGAPNANIRVGFLYNPKRVSLTEGVSKGDATTAVGYENGKLTHNPGRIDPNNEAFKSSRKPLAAQFDFQGENVVVIANHWNSKGGDTPIFGSQQPPVLGSEVQRNKIAAIVANFVDEVKTDNPNANIVSLGDFNDFQFAEPLKIHEGKHMKNLINTVEASDRYSYLYQGNSQVLDHILVSKNLEKHSVIDILHINADFTDMAGRASDHDPVMVQVDLKKPSKPTDPYIPPTKPVEPEKPTEPEKPEVPEPVTFDDIQTHWAKKQIEALASKGIVFGKSTEAFEPESKLSRSEFAVLLARALELPLKEYEGTFKDVRTSKAWAYQGIEAAARAGIVFGKTDGTYDPDAEITREEIAAMMIRAIEYQDASLLDGIDASHKFADGKKVGKHAVEAVAKAYGLGIISGRVHNKFDPKADITRAETIVILYRGLDKMDLLD